jgi:cytoskeletal protein RodZ
MTLLTALAAALVLVSTAALAAPSGIVAYPAQGQSAEQERKDQEACEQWARQRADREAASAPAPANTASAPAAQSAPARRPALPSLPALPSFPGLPPLPRPPSQPDAQVSASAEAAWQQAAETLRQQQPAAGEAQQPLYLRALAACMTGRGYSVK